MSTVAEPPQTTTRDVGPDEQRVVLRGVSWATFLRLVEETGDDRHALVAYNRGVLEIMSPGQAHEDERGRSGRMVSIVCEELAIATKAYGSTTWKRKKVKRSIEPDECYYFDRKKIARAKRLRSKGVDDTSKCPGPDLAIEIDHRRSAVDRNAIYASLKVAEVWRFDGRTQRIDRLGPDGTYREAESSALVPLNVAQISRWLLEEAEDDTDWAIRFRAWVRAELVDGR